MVLLMQLIKSMSSRLLLLGIGALIIGCDSSSSETMSSSGGSELAGAPAISDESVNDESSDGFIETSNDQMMVDLGLPEDTEEGPQGRLISGVISRGHWDGIGEEARFDGMVCATLSRDGAYLYVTDAFSGTVRSIDLETDEVSTLSGFPYEFAVFDGPLNQARFEGPRGCAAAPDQDGLLVADSATLRWISPDDAAVTTWTGRAGDTGDRDGSSSEARLGYLTHDVIWGPSGAYAFLSDRSNDRIRIFVKQTKTLHAFGPLMAGERAIRLSGPGGLALTDAGDLLIADTFNGQLVRVNINALDLDQRISEQAQGDELPELDLGMITAEVVADRLSDPQGVATSGDQAWVAGFNGAITEVNLLTGDTAPLSVDLSTNKEPALGGAFAPMLFDPVRSVIYYLDIDTESVRKVDPETGVVKSIAGPKNPTGDRDGSLDTARFGILYDVVGTDQGWIVADPEYGKVRRVITEGDDAGVVTLISKSATARSLRLPPERVVGESPVALAYDEGASVLYIADLREHVIRSYNLTTQEVAVVIGAVDETGAQDGIGTEARLNEPFVLDFGPDGLLYIADAGNQAVRSFDPETQEVVTLAQGGINPFDVLKHSDGNIYVVDGEIPVVYQVVDGQFEPVIGNAEEMGPGDGEDGRFSTPIALTRYVDGKILVIDAENHRIRIADLESGTLNTWLGQFTRRGGWGHRDPLPWGEIRLQSPNAVARYGDASMVLSDTGLIFLNGDPHLAEE